MQLTVCICTHNRPHYLRGCLEGLARQTVGQDAFAVLVVDSCSAPDSAAALAPMVAAAANAKLLRVNRPGVSLARNAGAWACRTPYIAYIDDDATPADDWIASILAALEETHGEAHREAPREAPREAHGEEAHGEAISPPAVLGGRVLPRWEAPLPAWWPDRLRGVLSIIEAEGQGEYGDPHLPPDLAPYTVNMVVNVRALLAQGGFHEAAGRLGTMLLSDEDVQIAWRLRQSGRSVRFDSRIVVYHQIQAVRLTPAWLLSRLYWQGASTVLTRRLLCERGKIWRELPRRVAVAVLFAPAGLLPRGSTRLIGLRWRLAYALGFIRAVLGWHAGPAAGHGAAAPPISVAASP
jgi:glucosyl-dolichyl phosphate glucuronosyltransferase